MIVQQQRPHRSAVCGNTAGATLLLLPAPLPARRQ